MSHSSSIDKLLLLLDKKPEKSLVEPPLYNYSDSRALKFDNVHFSYSDLEIFSNLNLSIPLGSTIGLIGQTGSGKTTLVNILMGLLPPTNGRLLLDEIDLYGGITGSELSSWKSIISHVPQDIFLLDDTIEANIVFGSDPQTVDKKRLIESCRMACIYDYILSLPESFESVVGENGVSLSGGQRQRIGIARALYKGSKILILDEATSALDITTENNVMNSLRNLNSDITIVIVAHRVSTLSFCDKIYKVSNNNIVQTTI